MVSRRGFLKALGSKAAIATGEKARKIVDAPRSTLKSAVSTGRQYDKTVKKIKDKGPQIMDRRKVLKKGTQEAGKLTATNPAMAKTTASKIKKGGGKVKRTLGMMLDPIMSPALRPYKDRMKGIGVKAGSIGSNLFTNNDTIHEFNHERFKSKRNR